VVTLLLLAAAAAAQPSAEAMRLGRQLADHGTLAALLPLMKAKETEELLTDATDLSASEKERLRKLADETFEKGRNRLLDATAAEYAKRLSVADLRALVRFYETPAAKRLQAATPKVIAGTMQNVGKMDFKADVRKAFCEQTGKLCASK
jgi:hypothetical protein